MRLLKLVEHGAAPVKAVRGDQQPNYQMADGGSFDSRAHIQAALKRGRSGYQFWVALNDAGEVVGALSGYISRPLKHSEDVFYISDLGSLHGGGVGITLLNTAIAWGFSQELEVWLNSRSTSRGFYEKAGMREVDGMFIATLGN